MCCRAKLNLTKNFLRRNREKKSITVYKVLTRYGRSPYMNYAWCPGILSINIDRIKKDTDITHGYHVWLSRKSAETHANRHNYCVVVPVHVRPKDVIGVGYFDDYGENDNAVFNRVSLHTRDYNRIFRS